jgi:hypothetical protein
MREDKTNVKVYRGIRVRGICLKGIKEKRGRQARERRGEAGRMHTYV